MTGGTALGGLGRQSVGTTDTLGNVDEADDIRMFGVSVIVTLDVSTRDVRCGLDRNEGPECRYY